jgi:Protein of unknown function (DUF3800)
LADTRRMLLAYIDEIGETGAFVSKTDPRFRTSPAFGYAGFVVPDGAARRFGQLFDREKRTVFAPELARAAHPGRWEKKGSELFHSFTAQHHPEQLRVFNGLVRLLCERFGGALFYYAEEKPVGTPKQTRLDKDDRETRAMREALNRLCTHADREDQHLLVMIDQINEKDRAKRLPLMYEHILGRADGHAEMRRIVEPPMHVDSALSANIQFADWIAAAVSRAVERQLLVSEVERNAWIPPTLSPALRRVFTRESKLHVHSGAHDDLHGAAVFSAVRPLAGRDGVRRIVDAVGPQQYRLMREAAERAAERGRP